MTNSKIDKTNVLIIRIITDFLSKQAEINSNQFNRVILEVKEVILNEIAEVMAETDIDKDLIEGETLTELYKRKLDLAFEIVNRKLEKKGFEIVNKILKENNL